MPDALRRSPPSLPYNMQTAMYSNESLSPRITRFWQKRYATAAGESA